MLALRTNLFYGYFNNNCSGVCFDQYVCLFASCSGESEASKPLGKGETKTGAGLLGEVSWVWELQKCESGGF